MKSPVKAMYCGAAAFLFVSAAQADSNETLKTALQKLLPNFKVTEIRPSPVSGLSEVLIGPRLFYVTDDGKYMFQGNLIDIEKRENVSEQVRRQLRSDAVDNVSRDDMVIFPAKDEQHHITVFTDIDCGYCRKLHNEVPAMNEKGITVRYLMYPRSGPNTPSYSKAVTVMCSDDRQDALTRSKQGEMLETKTCVNPVREHYELGGLLGVTGTPAIVLDDGELVPGYLPAKDLSLALKKRAGK